MGCIKEFTFKGRQLSEEQMKALFVFIKNKDKDYFFREEEGEFKLPEDLESIQFYILILLKRIKCLGLPFKVSEHFILMSMITFVDRPGSVIILLRLMYQHYLKTGCEDFNIETWCLMFPDGVPSEEELRDIWYSQKVSNNNNLAGNALDDSDNWKERYRR